MAQLLGVPFLGLLPKKLLVGVQVACLQRVLIDAGWKVAIRVETTMRSNIAISHH
nr:unnamed protein product [Digitaria exilis]